MAPRAPAPEAQSTSSSPLAPPKAILFDIGGVTCLSPFTAIASYETTHNIPLGWINYAISRSTPNGAWGRLERGEQRAGAEWFQAWREDLRHQDWWEDFWKRKERKARAGTVLVREEKTRRGGGVQLAVGGHSEDTNTSTPVVAVSAAGADADLPPPGPQSIDNTPTPPPPPTPQNTISQLSTVTAAGADLPQNTIPPPPDIDTEQLFNSMMSAGRTPDPYIFPAILSLRRSKRFIIGALSNTSLSSSSSSHDSLSPSPPPIDHTAEVRAAFDLFVSSAHVGMRKPEPRIYEHTMTEVRRIWRESGREVADGELRAGDILFLDDIGANLRAAREMGWRTIKVGLGQSAEAVRELESVTGVVLVREKGRL